MVIVWLPLVLEDGSSVMGQCGSYATLIHCIERGGVVVES